MLVIIIQFFFYLYHLKLQRQDYSLGLLKLQPLEFKRNPKGITAFQTF